MKSCTLFLPPLQSCFLRRGLRGRIAQQVAEEHEREAPVPEDLRPGEVDGVAQREHEDVEARCEAGRAQRELCVPGSGSNSSSTAAPNANGGQTVLGSTDVTLRSSFNFL